MYLKKKSEKKIMTKLYWYYPKQQYTLSFIDFLSYFSGNLYYALNDNKKYLGTYGYQSGRFCDELFIII